MSAIKLMENNPEADAVVSVNHIEEPHPDKLFKINHENQLEPYMEKYKKPYEGRRQDLPKVYSRNGAIYLIKVDHILNESSIYGGVTIPYIMPFERSINIDTYNDIILMKSILNHEK